MKSLNLEEFYVGLVVAVCWAPFLHLWVVPVALGCGYLWAYGGSEGVSLGWRRLGVPSLLCGSLALVCWSALPLVSWLPFWACLTLGYGIPSWKPDGFLEDGGSSLGRIAYEIVGGKGYGDTVGERRATILVRGLIAMLIGISLASLAFISALNWTIGTVVITILVPWVVVSDGV